MVGFSGTLIVGPTCLVTIVRLEAKSAAISTCFFFQSKYCDIFLLDAIQFLELLYCW